MPTTRSTVGHESTIDKVKDALHLNKDHTTVTNTTETYTTGTPNHNHNHGAGTHTRSGAGGITGATTGTGYSGTNHTGTNHTGTHYTGTSGGISNSTNAGPHDSNLANKLDPRVDSDLDGRGNRHGGVTGGLMGASGSHATPGSGIAQNTAGPHNSDTLNKIDPRVDADLDGSNTMGGNRTYSKCATVDETVENYRVGSGVAVTPPTTTGN
ncbi:hypothetical protein B7463_g5844, partial [Scytalidium lignicola]